MGLTLLQDHELKRLSVDSLRMYRNKMRNRTMIGFLIAGFMGARAEEVRRESHANVLEPKA